MGSERKRRKVLSHHLSHHLSRKESFRTTFRAHLSHTFRPTFRAQILRTLSWTTSKVNMATKLMNFLTQEMVIYELFVLHVDTTMGKMKSDAFAHYIP